MSRPPALNNPAALYVVYLNGIGLTGTTIGILFAAIETGSAFGSLCAGPAMRLGDPQRTMLSGEALSIPSTCATPFFGGLSALLLLAQVGRGRLQGIVQPMMSSVQAKAVGRYRQGSAVGLRQTMNRLSAIVVPPIMGAIADGWAPRTALSCSASRCCCCACRSCASSVAAEPALVAEAPEPS